MKIYVANPIYDSVFKYLMEDERVARTLLSALLKKEVLHVEQRPHEYSNVTKNDIAMFRIDFAATVKEADGHQHLILIELQKTWVDTETLRFRQYLGAQYFNKRNIVEESQDKHSLPMVAVYLLGHRVGDIEEPVLYVNHKSYDYDGNEVTKGMPDPFVESLTHDSVIVQIPLLHGKVNNRLEKVLSIFDQTKVYPNDSHIIAIDEEIYNDDSEMQHMLHRLNSAASNPDIRIDMNVEDEFFKAIDDRDTALMQRDKKIEQQDKKIEQQDKEIEEKDKEIEEKGKKIEQQDKEIEEKDKEIEEKGKKIEQQDKKIEQQGKELEEKDKTIRNLISNLYSNGITIEAIAQMTGKSEDEIRKLLKNT